MLQQIPIKNITETSPSLNSEENIIKISPSLNSDENITETSHSLNIIPNVPNQNVPNQNAQYQYVMDPSTGQVFIIPVNNQVHNQALNQAHNQAINQAHNQVINQAHPRTHKNVTKKAKKKKKSEVTSDFYSDLKLNLLKFCGVTLLALTLRYFLQSSEPKPTPKQTLNIPRKPNLRGRRPMTQYNNYT